MKKYAAYILKFFFLASAYFIAGRLSLLLAIPPGFASPVWPAAGIALAATLIGGYKYLPAVFLGSLGVNLYAATQSGADITSFTQITIACSIAAGAFLQALAGTYLVTRSTPIPTKLNNASSLTAVFVCGGIISCLVNGVIGPSTLLLFDMIPFSLYFLNVFTWWIGDIIGIVLFTPLILILSHRTVTLTRKSIVSFPIIICSIITIFVFTNAKQNRIHDQQNQFNVAARDITEELDQEIKIYLNILTAISQFFNASEHVNSREFTEFTGRFIENNPSIRSLQLVRKIPHDQRTEFESYMRAEGAPEYQIKDRIGKGMIKPAANRPVYFPITYITPLKGNEAAHGYDIYGPDILTDHKRNEILNLARDSARAHATGRVSLVQDEGRYGFLIYHPIYESTLNNENINMLRKNHTGYATGVFTMPDMLKNIANLANKADMDIIVHDTDNQSKTLLYDSRTPDHQEAIKPIKIENGALQYSTKLNIAGRVWSIDYIQKSAAITSAQNWGLWYILIGGLLFSASIGVFIILLSAKAESIEKEVEEYGQNTLTALWLSLTTAIIIMAFSIASWAIYKAQENKLIDEIINKQISLISSRISEDINLAVFALERMAQRWEVRNATPKNEWFADARQIVKDLPTLNAIEWVDETYHIRWVEPLKGNEKALNLNIAYNDERREILKRASKTGKITLTPPLDLVQGYRALIAYAPLNVEDKFGGFIVGIYDLEKLFNKILLLHNKDDFYIHITDEEKLIFQSDIEQRFERTTYKTQALGLFDRVWTIKLHPTNLFIKKNTSNFANIAFLGGVLFAIMVGFSTYTAIISNRRSLMLKQSEARINLVLDNAGAGICGLDLNGDITFVNKAATDTLGYNAAELIGASYHDLIQRAPTHGDKRDNENHILQAYKTGRTFTEDDEVFWHKDGRGIAVEYTSAPALDPYNNITGAVVVFRDITERKIAEDALKKANEELEEFAYRTSHDLRSPIVSSISLINMTKSTLTSELPKDISQNLGHIESSLKKLETLITDILALTETKNAEEQEQEINIELLIKESLQKLMHMDGFKRLDIRKDLNFPQPLKLKSSRITLIVENLLSNAIKYQDPAENAPYISIHTYQSNNCFILDIDDNGLGIAPEQHDKLFTMFKRFHPRVSFGSGLGLYMMQKSAEVLGGKVSFIDKNEKGTKFRLSIPLTQCT